MTRRHALTSVAMFVSIGLATSAPAGGSATTDVIEALSGIDYLPGTSTLTEILGGDLATLANVANNDGGDPGVRLRAYRSLGQFDSDAARQGLKVGIDRYRGAEAGTELLYLIAAAEGLGAIARPDDVSTLAPLLDAPSRDLRVVVARALGHVHDAQACALLRRRQPVEPVDQVELAIAEAIAGC